MEAQKGYKMCLSQWDAGTYTLTCLTPKAGTLPVAMCRPIKIQIRIRFLRHLKSQQQKWSEVEWEETVRGLPAACPTQSPEPSLGTGSALSLSWRSSVWCVCVSLSLRSRQLSTGPVHNCIIFRGHLGSPGIVPVPEDPALTPGDLQSCPQARCMLPTSWSSSLQSGAE